MKIIFLCLVVTVAIDTKLPEMVRRDYKGDVRPVINVTMGEKFSIPLPEFDTPWNNETFHTYEMSPEDLLMVDQG